MKSSLPASSQSAFAFVFAFINVATFIVSSVLMVKSGSAATLITMIVSMFLLPASIGLVCHVCRLGNATTVDSLQNIGATRRVEVLKIYIFKDWTYARTLVIAGPDIGKISYYRAASATIEETSQVKPRYTRLWVGLRGTH